MSNGKYFESPAIGSSILGTVIERIERDENGVWRPLICLDRATVPVKPSKFMQVGKMFEDLVEQEFSGRPVFTEKYFKSELNEIPTTTAKGVRCILRMFENARPIKTEEYEPGVKPLYTNTLHRDVAEGYQFTKPNKDGEVRLNKTYAPRHQCLDEIKAHNYHFPVPTPTWEKLQVMLERFKNYPLEINGSTKSIWNWRELVNIQFQVEHFWEHESGAECRAKFDMVWTYQAGNETYAIPFDLKVTADEVGGIKSIGVFNRNWTRKYIWQSKHYMTGFADWCQERGFIPYPRMSYIVQESEEPQVTHVRALSESELTELTLAYDESVAAIWEWIGAGKPILGHTPQRVVDIWGKRE